MSVVKLQNVILLTGRYDINDHEVRFTPAAFDAKQYGLMLRWKDAAYPYFQLRFSVGGKPVVSGRESYAEMAKELGLEGKWLKSPPDVQVACMLTRNTNDTVTVSGYINTNDPRFREAAESLPEGQILAVRLKGFMLSAVGENEATDLVIAVTPAAPAKSFPGAVGLDLGNHNSTIAAYQRSDPKNALLVRESAKGRNAQISADAAPVLSTVVIRSVRDGKLDDSLDSIAWETGQLATQRAATTMDGVELAAKKLIASPFYTTDKTFRVLDRLEGEGANKIDVSVPRYLPGELLACRLLHEFREATRCFPEHLAVSYPTMFSEREVLQLREVLHRAWLRMKPAPQNEENMMALNRQFFGPASLVNDDSGILLMLDEASAAAFFFLFEKILQSSGQLARFRYLYPNGLNLLLFDCGGGTTDIALVRAIVRPSDQRRLVLTVRGRVGRRDFGGQFITEAVFRILKAKVAHLLSPDTVPGVPSGEGVTQEKLDTYLTRHRSAIDKIIPTQFERRFGEDTLSAKARERLTRSMNLWRLADDIKIQLAASQSGRVMPSQDVWKSLEIPGHDHSKILGQLKNLSIFRNEIDALVHERLSGTIQICNDLIRQKLIDKTHTGIEEDHHDAEEVHLVVAAGAACRYPLVTEQLRQELDVPFLKSEDSTFSESRMTCDDGNLKHAVAKGLARVLMTKNMDVGLKITFDSELSQRLPFEVVYPDAEGKRRVLFRENEHITMMTDSRPLFPNTTKRSQAASNTENDERPGEFVVLYRRFPGEKEDSPYLQFRFREGVDGELKVRYESQPGATGPGRSPFVMTNEATFEDGECTDLTPEDSYLHPVQRGDL